MQIAIAGVCSLLDIGPLFLQCLLGTYFGWLYLRSERCFTRIWKWST